MTVANRNSGTFCAVAFPFAYPLRERKQQNRAEFVCLYSNTTSLCLASNFPISHALTVTPNLISLRLHQSTYNDYEWLNLKSQLRFLRWIRFMLTSFLTSRISQHFINCLLSYTISFDLLPILDS